MIRTVKNYFQKEKKIFLLQNFWRFWYFIENSNEF